jgi:hypothetical protein
MQIDIRLQHAENDPPPIRVSFDPDSKVTEQSSLQRWKHVAQIISTDAGTQIDLKVGHPENASAPITASFDRDSKVTDRRPKH